MKKKLEQLINLSLNFDKDISVIFINGDKRYTEAESGYLETHESEEIHKYLTNTFSKYLFYNNPSTFVGDIVLNKIDLDTKYNFLYSTAQIGRDINRRSFIPNFSKLHNIYPITCNSYELSLLQNKKHYYQLSSKFCSVPNTFVYNGRDSVSLKQLNSWNEYIIKPNLECAARGIKVLQNLEDILLYSEKIFQDFGQEILIQEFIDGLEIEVPVVSTQLDVIALSPIVINKTEKYLTSETVDNENYTFYELEHPLTNLIKESAENIIKNLGCSGICRVDFILKNDDSFWLFDIAAIPLITQHGSCRFAFDLLFPHNPAALYQVMVGAKLSELI